MFTCPSRKIGRYCVAWVVDSEGSGTLTADVVGKKLRDQRIIFIKLASTDELLACEQINIIP